LIETTANKLADDFFGKFNEILDPETNNVDEVETTEKQSKGLSQNSWIIVLIILTSLSLLFWYSLS
jgi:hypothetical protein